MSVYDDPRIPTGGDFPPLVTLEPGNSIRLAVTEVRIQTFKDKTPPFEDKPTIVLDGVNQATGAVCGVSCGSWRLRDLVKEQQPFPGDVVEIACIGKDGNSKLWAVTIISRGAGTPPVAAPAAAPAQAYVPPVAPVPAPAAAPVAYAPPAGGYVPPQAMPAQVAPVAAAPAAPLPDPQAQAYVPPPAPAYVPPPAPQG